MNTTTVTPETPSGWAEFDSLVTALRSIGSPQVAQELVDAMLAGATGSEILGDIGLVLLRRRGVRQRLTGAPAQDWDAVADAVARGWPGWRRRYFAARWLPFLVRFRRPPIR